jgi:hypothetical protein
MKRIIAGLAVAALAFAAACSEMPTESLRVQDGPDYAISGIASSKTTVLANLTPELGYGNFVSSDDYQLCYDIFLGDEYDEFDFHGFKVNSNSAFQNAFIKTTISANKQELKWEATNAEVLAVIMKGGPNYNLYDYHTPRFSQGAPAAGWNKSMDYWLTSPSHQIDRFGNLRYPEISHYNFCYIADVPEGFQGCTPGYWRNHADRWIGVAPTDDFDATFGVDVFNPDMTLGWAIWAQGGGINAFARHATAALLNAYGGVPNDPDGTTVDYPYTVAQVIQMVQDAVTNGTIEATKNLFEAANELGCPLRGTRAVPVVP